MSFGYSCAADFESYFRNQFCLEGNDFEFGMRFVVVEIVCNYIDFDSFEMDENFCWNILQSYFVVSDKNFGFGDLTDSVFWDSTLLCVLSCGKVCKNE